MRKETINHIRSKAMPWALLPLILLLFVVSCTDDTEDSVAEANATAVSMGITFRTRNISSDSETYVAGSEYENYIDVAGGDYRIYFFTYDPEDESKSNKYIARFEPGGFVKTETEEYTTYEVLGEVPSALGDLVNKAEDNTVDFKIVILANWGTDNYYSDDDLEVGITTIDDICEPNKDTYPNLGTFAHKENFELSSTNLIPFYGVREYTDKEFKSGKATLLYDEPVTLLRAMAKVEVILEPDEDGSTLDVTFTSVKICHYNDRGYCAPYEVYKTSDYDSGYTSWSNDFVNSLHLVGGENNDQAGHEPISMYPTKDDEGNDMWVAYVPEYDNTSKDAVYSYIEIMTSDQTDGDEPYKIYFANYTDGTTDAYDEGGTSEDRYDIYRNNLYRFKVSIVKGYLRVKPQLWEAEWTNGFEFGSTSTSDDTD